MPVDNPLIEKVLKKYPDVNVASLNFPAGAIEWTETDIELFVGSGGFIKPKKKKTAATSSPSMATSVNSHTAQATPVSSQTNSQQSTTTAAHEESVTNTLTLTSAEIAPAAPINTLVAANAVEANPSNQLVDIETSTPVSVTPGTPNAQAHTGKRAVPPDNPSESTWVQPAPRAEVDMMQEVSKNRWQVPLVTFMEDVGPQGLKLVAALNKCERSRSAALARGANFDLATLKHKHGTGILLREFALEVFSQPPADIMSVLWCETRVELPCAPFMPIVHSLLPSTRGAAVCEGRFNLLMLDVKTMNVLSDNSVYEQVAAPLRKTLGIPKPTGKEGVPKFPRLYPARGRPFQPLKLLRTEYVVTPGDCDMYRVIFHPQVAGVCERVNFALGADFREQPGTAIYANLSRPAHVGDRFDVSVFVESSLEASQHRVLYLFATKGGAGAASCVMSIFVVYGPPPGALTAEDVGACGALKFGPLRAFTTSGTVGKPDKELDLSRCVRST